MTHLSEAIPTPTSSAGHLWGLFGNVDRTQWRWEAPTPRPAKTESNLPSLPAWLSEWDATSQEVITGATGTETAEAKFLVDGTPCIEEDIRLFLDIISTESDPDAHIESFNRRLEQNLTLGLVSCPLLAFALRRVTDKLREQSKNPHLVQARCFAFYNSVWRGISTSKVLGPVDFEGNIINELVDLISCLPSSGDVHVLAQSILSSVSRSQLQVMEHSITSLVKTWVQDWLEAPYLGDGQSAIQTAEYSVTSSEMKLLNAKSLVVALDGPLRGENDFTRAREAISGAHIATYQALNSIEKVERIVSPFKASAKLLAHALRYLPHDILLRVESSCLEYVKAVGSRRRRQHRVIRYCWLSTLAQIPSINTQLFLQTWKILEGQDSIPENIASDLILSHWISQGYVASATMVRNSFEATARRAGKEDFASLLLALHRHRENSLARTRELFLLLDDIGKYEKVYSILSRMNDLGLKVPVSYLRQSIVTMSNYDARLALKTFHLHKEMLLGDSQIKVDWIPNFVIALINDRGIPPKHIWEILKIPIYEKLPKSERKFQRLPLSQTMIELIHKMALAFAYSEARPPRVALRNVLQCLYHLRVHRAPIGSELSRAVTHIGITDEINKGQWIRQERLRYALHLINEVEGKEIAAKADATVLNWRMFLSEKQARQNREGNVLCVGTIG